METADPIPDPRQLSTPELIRLGEESLNAHLLEQAILAHQRYAPLAPDRLAALLSDPECVRYPTRLVFEFGEMAMHQFAQPDQDCRAPGEDRRVLFLRPALRDRPDLIALAVAYMLPLINYGEIITDEHCLLYGATLLGRTKEEFYREICHLADFVGSEARYAGEAPTGGTACELAMTPVFQAGEKETGPPPAADSCLPIRS